MLIRGFDHRCVVIEDSHIGMRAAKAAGMRCIVTTSSYTADEDFTIADVVFDSIGEGADSNFTMLDITTPGKLMHA
jgi:beta-phosphoglucomutase-like phosphatase (HAD superfamily)